MQQEELKKLIEDLNNWRHKKKDKREIIPISFWERALILDRKHPELCVRERCKFNSTQWRKHKIKNASESNPVNSPFLELPSSQEQTAPYQPSSGRLTLELNLPSGIIVRFF